jgi:hypothetical protein
VEVSISTQAASALVAAVGSAGGPIFWLRCVLRLQPLLCSQTSLNDNDEINLWHGSELAEKIKSAQFPLTWLVLLCRVRESTELTAVGEQPCAYATSLCHNYYTRHAICSTHSRIHHSVFELCSTFGANVFNQVFADTNKLYLRLGEK